MNLSMLTTFFSEHFDQYDNTLNDFYNVSSLLMQSNLECTRSSKDKNLNNEGKLLIDICKTNNLIILNGRCGKDKEIGN